MLVSSRIQTCPLAKMRFLCLSYEQPPLFCLDLFEDMTSRRVRELIWAGLYPLHSLFNRLTNLPELYLAYRTRKRVRDMGGNGGGGRTIRQISYIILQRHEHIPKRGRFIPGFTELKKLSIGVNQRFFFTFIPKRGIAPKTGFCFYCECDLSGLCH